MTAHGRQNADELLIVALAGGAQISEAAQTARVSESTAYRRLRDPWFAERVRQARAALVERAAARLAESAGAAVETLRTLLGADIPPAVRLGAARSVLELGLKVRDQTELERRLSEVEAALATTRAEEGEGMGTDRGQGNRAQPTLLIGRASLAR